MSQPYRYDDLDRTRRVEPTTTRSTCAWEEVAPRGGSTHSENDGSHALGTQKGSLDNHEPILATEPSDEREESVKKFLMLSYGYEEPTPEVMAAWMAWFAKVGDRFADMGSPLGNCLEVTKTGTRDLSPDMGAATGYSILSAESREDAERLLEGCPIISSVRLYEEMSM